MKITLLVVGKTTDTHIQALVQEYQKRLLHYVPFALTVIPELKNTKSLTVEQQKQEEGELILRNVTASMDMILLDERGKEYRSIEFADYIQKKMLSSRDLVFVVGGPYGFSDAVYQRANGKISLSKMTFSHQMIRLFFVEQIYRAMTILRGEPYHHE
jgi:23S rRNA (pseudouridine1915-N3)-methyltransferase